MYFEALYVNYCGQGHLGSPIKPKLLSGGVHTCNPALEWLTQDSGEFEASLGYRERRP